MRDSDNQNMLQILDLSAAYGEVLALDQVTLDVKRGEILGLIGPNGAGKSTLIRVLSGILRPKSGTVFLNQQDVTGLSPAQRARVMAVVPQARQLGGAFTVQQAVLLGRTTYLGILGKASAYDQEKTWWAMEQTCVDDLAERRLAEISGGEQQRVLLARALAQETPVLLLDEPTNHLDLGYQIGFLSLVKDLVDREGLTVLMAMHDLNQVAGIADRVGLLIQGRLKELGTPLEVINTENITQAYQTPVEIIDHPETGLPFILPYS